MQINIKNYEVKRVLIKIIKHQINSIVIALHGIRNNFLHVLQKNVNERESADLPASLFLFSPFERGIPRMPLIE